MLDSKNLFELAKVTVNANPAAPVAYSFGDDKFSYSELNETLRKELREYAATPALYRENKNVIFSLIENIVDDVLPKKVMEMYGMFAEIKQFGQGDKAIFTQRVTAASRRRAKKFITKVGLAGVYEVFKLDGRSFSLETTAYGGAAEISIEEFLDGRVDLAELLDIVMEGLNDAIYNEIALALVGMVKNIPGEQKHSDANFDEANFDELLQHADSYAPTTIYCTYEFAAKMIPAKDWASESVKNELWNKGYLANYKGHNVVILPQSYEWKDNGYTKKVINPALAYLIPSNAGKVVKVAFEGQTMVKETEQDDWSKHIDVYKKIGVGVFSAGIVHVYENDALLNDDFAGVIESND
jgi:hypothetical protein